MINKHKKVFERMYQKILIEGKGATEVIKEHSDMLKEERISPLRVIYHIGEYLKERQN